jgi:Ca2+-binding EF-hand superfamily protein
LFQLVQKTLADRKEKLVQVFFSFDKDQDTFLSSAEFGQFLKTYCPGVTPAETQAALDWLNPFRVDSVLVSLY